jgi:GPI ethanolamine phosphate transferase 2/3 subunit F
MYNYQSSNLLKQYLTILMITLLEIIASIFIFYFISISFGASLIETFNETLLFSLLMTFLCTLPTLILTKHDDPIESLYQLIFTNRNDLNKIEYISKSIAIGAVIGAWLGALVIPLDWDRWWQQWPISCCFGAISGSILFTTYKYFRNEFKFNKKRS